MVDVMHMLTVIIPKEDTNALVWKDTVEMDLHAPVNVFILTYNRILSLCFLC